MFYSLPLVHPAFLCRGYHQGLQSNVQASNADIRIVWNRNVYLGRAILGMDWYPYHEIGDISDDIGSYEELGGVLR